jgi:predicted RNA-binding protein Jag
MEKTIVTTGKTIDLAVEAALTQLGLDRDSVSVQVLSQAKPGFLGLGAQPARVQVSYEAPDPAPAAPRSALGSASRSKPKAAPVKKPEPVAPKQEQPKETAKPEAPKERKVEEKPKAETPKAPKEPKVYDAEDAERLKKHLEEERLEAEKERIRAERRAANPDGITDNTSKKKMQKKLEAEKEAAKAAAAKEYAAKKGIVEEEKPEKTVMSGIPSRPYCKGRNYDPNRYSSNPTEE